MYDTYVESCTVYVYDSAMSMLASGRTRGNFISSIGGRDLKRYCLFCLVFTFCSEEAHHMREVIVDETIQDMDKNKDGKITLEEYISKHILILYNAKSAILVSSMYQHR